MTNKRLTIPLALLFWSAMVFSAETQPASLLWTFDANNLIRSSPAVAPDNTIYFGAGGTLYAITNRGSNKWEFATDGANDSSPAVADGGTVYYSTMSFGSPSSGYLYAISSSGTQNWRYAAQSGSGAPAIGRDGTIYINGGFYLHAVAAGGTSEWTYPVRSDTSSLVSPALQRDDSVCIGSYADSKFYSLAKNGSLKWTFPIHDPGDSPAIGIDDTLYFTGGLLYAFSSAGTNQWTTQTNDFQRSSLAIGSDGTIYVPTSGGSLCAFSPLGDFKWQVLSNGYSPGTTPAIDSAGTIYYAAYSVLYAISPAGSVMWSLPMVRDPGDPFGTSRTSPTIGPDGTIYVTSANRFYAFAGTNKLADSAWPMYRQNARHTGKIEKPSLTQPKKRSDNNFQFQMQAQLGGTNVIEASTNLTSWAAITNVVVTNVPMDVVDLKGSNFTSRFYRALSP